MGILARSPIPEREPRPSRGNADGERWNEVWEGVLVVPALPNDEHQEIQTNFLLPLLMTVGLPGLGRVRAGVNVSDRAGGWSHNYRGPDVVVYLRTNPAVGHGTHWEGGPDFLAEIISPAEDPYAKFDFYAAVNTREVLIVHRDPWAVELFQLRGGRLDLVGRSDLAGTAVLTSAVLPLTFQLQPGATRPTIAVAHTGTGQRWTV